MKRLLLFAALVAWSGMAGAVVYRWVDAQGKVQYGDRPPDGVHAEVVELLGTHVAPGASAGAPPPDLLGVARRATRGLPPLDVRRNLFSRSLCRPLRKALGYGSTDRERERV